MKVLLLNPPFLPNFIRSARSTWPSISGSNWYPIFLAYASGWLLEHGHTVKLLDALVEGMSIHQTVKESIQFKPDLLALYISQDSLTSDITIGEKIKSATGCQIILVGPWCAVEPESVIKRFKKVDGIVRREFDDVLLDLANSKSKKDILGLTYREGKLIYSNGERPFLTGKQLDSFPFVTEIYKRFLPIHKYYQASLLHPFVDLFAGRGCIWGKCTFCLWPNTIHKGATPYRMRSIDNIIAELKYIKKELPFVKEVFFQDDTMPSGRAREISERILKEGIRLKWSCYARANMDFETLILMHKAGCRYLHVGYESADTTVLQLMKKGTTLSAMKTFTENAKKAKIRVHGDFIIGLPGETIHSIRKTILWAKNLGIEGYQFFVPQPIPSTPLYEELSKKGYLKKDGRIDYPHLSNKELEHWRFKAMKEIYFTRGYIINTLKNINSVDDFLRLFRTALHVIPHIFRRTNGQ